MSIVSSDLDEGLIADMPDLKACSAVGATPEEAIREVLIAKQAWLDAARAEHRPVPHRATASPSTTSRCHAADMQRYTGEHLSCPPAIRAAAVACRRTIGLWHHPPDAAVLSATRWLADDALLERLLALDLERAGVTP